MTFTFVNTGYYYYCMRTKAQILTYTFYDYSSIPMMFTEAICCACITCFMVLLSYYLRSKKLMLLIFNFSSLVLVLLNNVWLSSL